jgi:hypothetical protein
MFIKILLDVSTLHSLLQQSPCPSRGVAVFHNYPYGCDGNYNYDVLLVFCMPADHITFIFILSKMTICGILWVMTKNSE